MIVEEKVLRIPLVRAGDHEGVMAFVYRDDTVELEITATADVYEDREFPGAFDVNLRKIAVSVEPWFSESGSLTAEMFRLVPVGEIRQRVRATFAAVTDSPVASDLIPKSKFVDARKEGPTAETLRLFASVYLNAERYGKGPIVEAVKRFGISRATATRWGQLARAKGLLPSLEKGRENESTKE